MDIINLMLKAKILVVDDECAIRELLEMLLEANGFFDIKMAADGEEAIKLAEEWQPDVILLDLMLPKIDGLTVCKMIRSNSKTTSIPIIMLTAKSEESDIVLGLELGANDYITKPFSNKIVIARIRNQLRNIAKETNKILYESLIIDTEKRTALLDNEFLDLTYSEYEILYLLAKNPGRVYTRSQLISSLKGDSYYDVTDRTIDVQIVNLRKKLGDFGKNIITIRSIGYCIKSLENS